METRTSVALRIRYSVRLLAVIERMLVEHLPTVMPSSLPGKTLQYMSRIDSATQDCLKTDAVVASTYQRHPRQKPYVHIYYRS